MTKEELEQELDIVESELVTARKEIAALRAKLDESEAGGTALATRDGETSLDTRALEIEDDLEAIRQLQNPPMPEGKAETSLDIVKANNRERAELQERLSAANNIVSRVAALARIDKWDAEGTEIREAVQRFQNLAWTIGRKRVAVEREIGTLQKHEADVRAELTGWLRAFDFVVEKLGKIADADDLARDATRYRRLRVLGAAPYVAEDERDLLCFTKLDRFVDADIERNPSRGEAE